MKKIEENGYCVITGKVNFRYSSKNDIIKNRKVFRLTD